MTTTTTTALDTRDMVVVHDALRREYRLMPDLVRGVAPGDSLRTQVVADHVALVAGLLHHHHTGEDRLLWPVLLPRVADEAADTVQLMERQHVGIHQAQERADAALARWRADGDDAAREELADALTEVGARLTEHLAAEEAHLLPLAAHHLTADEWARLGEEGMAGVEKKQLPLVLGLLMYQADPEVIAGMLAHAPLPVRMVMPHVAPRTRNRYVRHVYGRTDL